MGINRSDLITKRDIHLLLSDCTELFRTAGYGHIELADTLLSLSLWKYLSGQTYNQNTYSATTQWVTPGEEFGFDWVVSHRHNRDLKYDYERAAAQWERLNQELQGLMTIARLKSIPDKVWEQVCALWFNFFSYGDHRTGSAKEEQLYVLDHIEGLLARNYGEAHIFFTPRDVVSLMVNMLGDMNDKEVYDPYCRSGDMLSLAASRYRIKRIEGNAQENVTWKMARIRLLMLDTANESMVYKGMPENKTGEHKYDFILTNPPFGPIYNREALPDPVGEWSEEFQTINRLDVRFLCHVIDRLDENGRAAIIVPSIILSGKGMLYELRKKLVTSNLLEGIISLPKVFYGTGVSAVILLLNKQKRPETVTMVDATGMGRKASERMELQAEEVKAITQLFLREKETLTNEDRITSHHITVTAADIEKHDFDLQFSCYQSSGDDYFKSLVSSEQLKKECEALEKDLAQVQREIRVLITRNPKEGDGKQNR